MVYSVPLALLYNENSKQIYRLCAIKSFLTYDNPMNK